MKFKKLTCILIATAVAATTMVTAFADREDDLKAQKSAAQASLGQTYAALDSLAEQQRAIQAEIKDINQEIVDLMIRIDQAKQDIADTEEMIEQTQEDIEITKANLAEAEAVRDKQYEDMKKRIQYIYENGGDIGWAAMLFSEKDITSFFNKAEYTEQLHSYDREQLEAYIATVEEIQMLKAQLEEQMQQLQDQKASLEAQKAALEEVEAELEVRLAEAEAENDNYEAQIAEARYQAQQIQNLIYQMNTEIARIQEAKRKAAEEAARRAAEEAARRAAAEEAARQQAAAAQAAAAQQAAQQAASQSASAAMNQVVSQAATAAASGNATQAAETAAPAATSSGASGSSIVSYANQFVGNPYVWGGNSLTNGVDCSHFVYNVLKNTGNYSGGYATSGAWASKGTAVGSLSEAQAGDIIVSPGHVSIYDGNGGIIEAQNPSAGVTNNRSASSLNITAIRRF